MCKIAVIPKITKKTQANAWKFAKAMAPLMSVHDNDGFGYMAYGNGIFGERWLTNKDAFVNRFTPSEIDRGIMAKYQDALIPDVGYSSFGRLTDDITCLALHARMSTNTISMRNTHPFVSNNTALIHNGVISNPDSAKQYTSTCDSEVILTYYNESDVANEIESIDNVIKQLQGYFAVAAITMDNNNIPYLDIFKCDDAKLFAVFVKQLDCVVFCTDPQIVYKACKRLKWSVGSTFKVESYMLLRHNAITGELVDTYNCNIDAIEDIEDDTLARTEVDYISLIR